MKERSNICPIASNIIITQMQVTEKRYYTIDDIEDKFQAYRIIPSLEEYLMVEQDEIYVQHYLKIADKRWSIQLYDEEDEKITLTTVPFEITLQDLYNKVKFDTIESESESANSK